MAVVEKYNGTSWTEVADLNTGRSAIAASGVDNTSIAAVDGFQGSTYYANVELWNGSNWTETTDLNTARRYINGSGTSTSALAYGGSPYTAITESWNGSSWTEISDLGTARYGMGTAGTSNTSALAFGGFGGQSLTEEYAVGPVAGVVTIDAS